MDHTTNSQQSHNQKKRPSDFWRTDEDETSAEPLTAEEIARATDAVNFALVAFGVPDKFRPYVDALIGASSGAQKVRAFG